MAISRAPASSAASSPLAFGTSTGKETPLWRATAFRTLAVSAICGAHLGETKLPASMDVSPAAISFSMKAMRVSTETATASFCKSVARSHFHDAHPLGHELSPLSLELGERRAFGDKIAHGAKIARDAAAGGRAQRVLHLHGFEDEHGRALIQQFAGLGQKRDDGAGHGRDGPDFQIGVDGLGGERIGERQPDRIRAVEHGDGIARNERRHGPLRARKRDGEAGRLAGDGLESERNGRALKLERHPLACVNDRRFMRDAGLIAQFDRIAFEARTASTALPCAQGE